MSVITLTLNPHDRLTLATTIEPLINLLDALDPDADLEPSLGFVGHGTGHREGERGDDREQEIIDEPHDGDELEHDDGYYDFGAFIWGGNEDAPRNHSGL